MTTILSFVAFSIITFIVVMLALYGIIHISTSRLFPYKAKVVFASVTLAFGMVVVLLSAHGLNCILF